MKDSNHSLLILTPTRTIQNLVKADLKQQRKSKLYEVTQVYDWIKTICSEYINDHEKDIKILKEASTNLVWHQMIRDSFKNHKKQNNYQTEEIMFSEFSKSMVDQAIEAYHALIQWNVPQDYFSRLEHGFYLTSATKTFLEWKQEFETLCDSKGWLVVYKMADQLGEWIQQGKIKLPDVIYYSGFDAIVPQIKNLFEIIAKHTQLNELSSVEIKSNFQASNIKNYYKFLDKSTEIYSVAQWAYEIYQKDYIHYEFTDAKFCPIGIIFDDLNPRQNEVEDIFGQVFMNMNTSSEISEKPYNIEMSQSLGSLDIIKQMIFLLSLYPHKKLSLSQINYLILNYKVKSKTDDQSFSNHQINQLTQRIEFDNLLRRNNQTHYSLKELCALLNEKNTSQEEHAKKYIPEIELLLLKYFELYDTYQCTKQNTPDTWINYFNEVVQLWGLNDDFPHASMTIFKDQPNAESILDGHISTWLIQYKDSSSIFGKISLRDSITLLKNLAEDYALRFKESNSPIKILSTMESQSFHYDYLWLVDAHAQNYPNAPKPNAFLPIELQQEYKMPRATVENQFEFSSKLLNTWLENTQSEVNISFTEHHKNEELRPSNLILDSIHKKYHQVSYYPKKIEYYDYIRNLKSYLSKTNDSSSFIWKNQNFYANDFKGTDLNQDHLKSVIGGTFIFKEQAKCPFSAFAKFRLKLKEFNIPEEGLDSNTRGILVHNCLAYLWNEIKTSKRLKELFADSALTEFKELFEHAMLDVLKDKKGNIFQLEKIRIYNLVVQWLNYELERKVDFEVAYIEHQFSTELHGINLKVKADRIDYLPELNQYIIIDYKSNSAGDPANWKTPRMNEPQIPIYAHIVNQLHENQLGGFFFGNVIKHNLEFKGKYDNSLKKTQALPSISSRSRGNIDIQSQLSEWEEDLEQLATEFSQGYAKIDPKTANSCNYCPYGLLCREKK